MIPNLSVAIFAVQFILTFLAPILVLAVLAVKKKITAKPMWLGFACFFATQLVLRLPILQVLSSEVWFQNFAQGNTILYGLLLAFTAGLFEESGRLAGAKILKRRISFRDAVSFGLGHACCELIFLIGMTALSNLIYCLVINSNDPLFLASIPSDQLTYITNQLASASVPDLAAALLERASALSFHVLMTVVVFLGAVRHKAVLYWLFALLLHTVFDSVALLPIGMWPVEIILVVMGAACLAATLKIRKPYGEAYAALPAEL